MNRRSNVRLTALMAVSVFIITAVVAFVGFRLSNNSVSAATLTDYGNVMSDYTIRDYNSMSETDIQAFLTRVNGCGNRNYSDYVYLSTTRPQYTWHWRDGHFVCISEERFEVAQPTRSWSSRYNVWYDDFTASPRFGDALAPGEGASAASIIYKAAQDYKINPKVIITFLQKEQGLITDPIPNSRDYGVAMGYNCPDSGRCPADENDRGFSTQVFHMAKRLDEYMSGDLNYYPGNTYIFDGQSVYIRNTATAGLYTYTPHISDKINLYGIYSGWFDGIDKEDYLGSKENVKGLHGVYKIESKLNKNVELAVNNNNTIVQNKDEVYSQYWEFKYNDTDDTYEIADAKTGKNLDIDNALYEDGTNIKIWEVNGNCAQRWKVYSINDYWFTIYLQKLFWDVFYAHSLSCPSCKY